MPETPPNELYARTRDDLIELARSLTSEQAATEVPMCPGWSVKDTVAHVCGIVDDVLEERLEGIGGDEWTARQVSVREGRSLAEVCDEWTASADAIDEVFRADPFLGVRLIADLIVHVHDIRHALGLPIDREDEATMVAAHRYVPAVQERVRDRLGVELDIQFTGGTTTPTSGDGADPEGLRLRTTPYDFLRSVSGRRSRSQVDGLEWTGDPTAVLDQAWTSYGPLRTDDVSV